jgi:hypothetical protein
MNFMRLSSMKAAHAAVARCRVQEIRVKPYFGLSGILALNPPPSILETPLREIRQR